MTEPKLRCAVLCFAAVLVAACADMGESSSKGKQATARMVASSYQKASAQIADLHDQKQVEQLAKIVAADVQAHYQGSASRKAQAEQLELLQNSAVEAVQTVQDYAFQLGSAGSGGKLAERFAELLRRLHTRSGQAWSTEAVNFLNRYPLELARLLDAAEWSSFSEQSISWQAFLDSQKEALSELSLRSSEGKQNLEILHLAVSAISLSQSRQIQVGGSGSSPSPFARVAAPVLGAVLGAVSAVISGGAAAPIIAAAVSGGVVGAISGGSSFS